MKALRLHGIGDLRCDEVPVPEPKGIEPVSYTHLVLSSVSEASTFLQSEIFLLWYNWEVQSVPFGPVTAEEWYQLY